MDWKTDALTRYPNDVQKTWKIRAAIHELEASLGLLASVGFPLHVKEGPAPSIPVEWPKRVFHLRAGERTVQCQQELDELGPDWYTSMEDAKHAAGMTKQMQRGGVFDRTLPAPLGFMQHGEQAHLEVPAKDPGAETEGRKLRRAMNIKLNGASGAAQEG